MNQMSKMNQAIFAAVARMLRPLVRILLRNGIPYGVFADLAKRVYVDLALEDFTIEGRKPSTSRASVITGLSRKEVSRVRNLPQLEEVNAVARYNRAARVTTGWIRDRRFSDDQGEPRELVVDDGENSFNDLVRIYSGDVPYRAVLDELVRVGAVERTGEGSVRLLARGYVPSTGDADKISILGVDSADLIATIDHNLTEKEKEPFLQRKVSYDNLPVEALEEIRAMAREHGQKLLEHLDRKMSSKDRDVNPEVQGTGRMRAGVGVYYFEEGFEEDNDD